MKRFKFDGRTGRKSMAEFKTDIVLFRTTTVIDGRQQ